jgi:hypothetical protein
MGHALTVRLLLLAGAGLVGLAALGGGASPSAAARMVDGDALNLPAGAAADRSQVAALRDAALREPDLLVVAQAVRSLVGMASTDAEAVLWELARSGRPELHRELLSALVDSGDRRLAHLLCELAIMAGAQLGAPTIQAVVRLGGSEAHDALQAIARRADLAPEVAECVQRALADPRQPGREMGAQGTASPR